MQDGLRQLAEIFLLGTAGPYIASDADMPGMSMSTPLASESRRRALMSTHSTS
jgi:hypothetical protein